MKIKNIVLQGEANTFSVERGGGQLLVRWCDGGKLVAQAIDLLPTYASKGNDPDGYDDYWWGCVDTLFHALEGYTGNRGDKAELDMLLHFLADEEM